MKRTTYSGIDVGGGDTAAPANLSKRLQIIHRHMTSTSERVLDCGCGRGAYVNAMRAVLGLKAFGVEIQADKVHASSVGATRGTLIQSDLAILGVRSGSFDMAVLNEVLEHVPCEDRTLQEIRRALRPEGLLIVMSPNRLYPFESHGVRLRRSGRSVPTATPFVPYVPLRFGRKIFTYWARNYWPWQLRTLIEGNGYTIIHHGYLWQTFEGITRERSRAFTTVAPILRAVSNVIEGVPLLRRLGISQLIVATPVRS